MSRGTVFIVIVIAIILWRSPHLLEQLLSSLDKLLTPPSQ